MDAGKIVAQKSISITPEDDTGTMFEKLSILGKDLLLETLPNLINGNITPVEQDESQVIFSPNITREQGKKLILIKQLKKLIIKFVDCDHFQVHMQC